MGILTGDKQVVRVGGAGQGLGIIGLVAAVSAILIAVGVAGYGTSQPIQAANESAKAMAQATAIVKQADTAREVQLLKASAEEALMLAKADATRVQAEGIASGLRDGIVIALTLAGVGVLTIAVSWLFFVRNRIEAAKTLSLSSGHVGELQPGTVRILRPGQLGPVTTTRKRVKTGVDTSIPPS